MIESKTPLNNSEMEDRLHETDAGGEQGRRKARRSCAGETKMVYLIVNWVLGIVALLGVTIFVPGFRVSEIGSALIAAGVIALFSAVLSTLLRHLTGTVSVIVWGSLVFIVNLFLFRISGLMIPGFAMTGFVPAISGAVALMAVNGFTLRYVNSLADEFDWDESTDAMPDEELQPRPAVDLETSKYTVPEAR